MTYFNGFCLRNENLFFENLLHDFGITLTQYDIVGFDYGAMLAFEHALQKIALNERVGKVILLSPIIYSHNINTPISNQIPQTQNIDFKSFIHTIYEQKILNKNEYITHAHFEKIAQYFTNLPFVTLKNLFSELCLFMYQKNMKKYRNTLLEALCYQSFSRTIAKKSLDNEKKKVLTFFDKSSSLRNLLRYEWRNFDKVQKKSKIFITFLAENDRIVNSKLVGSYLSKFGICYVLKDCNHFLINESIKF